MVSLADDARDRVELALRAGNSGVNGHPESMFLLQDLRNGAASELFVTAAGSAPRDTIWRIASMTKAITSACALLLVEEGRLNLNAPVARYIPEFAQLRVAELLGDGSTVAEKPCPPNEMLVKHLLNHTSGLVYGFSDGLCVQKASDPRKYAIYKHVCDSYRAAGVFDLPHKPSHSSDELIRRLATCPLANRPGRGYQYSLSTDVLGIIVARITGGTLEKFATARIFEPLGMTDAHWTLPVEKRERLATLYEPVDGALVPVTAERGSQLSYEQRMHFEYSPMLPYEDGNTHRSGGGGMVATVDDYAKFLRMVLAALKGRTNALGLPRVLSRASAKLMCCDSIGSISGENRDLVSAGWGFGLGFATLECSAAAGDLSPEGLCRWAGIFGTEYCIDPENELIMVMANQRFPWDLFDCRSWYRNVVYGSALNE